MQSPPRGIVPPPGRMMQRQRTATLLRDPGTPARRQEPATFVAILGAASTLAATLLGGGGAIVPMEDPVRESGYILSPMLILLGAAWTLYTSYLLLRASAISGEASYEDIAENTLGKIGSYTVQALIVLNAFLICVSVQGLFVDLCGQVKPFDAASRPVLVIIGGVIVLPITAFLRRVDRLAPISLFTAITAIIFLGFIIDDTAREPLPAANLTPGPSGDDASVVWLNAFCTITIAFVVQFNVLPVKESLAPTDAEASMMKALYIGMGLTFTVYLLTEVLAYVTYGAIPIDDIIAAYVAMGGGGFGTVQLSLGQLLSYPIIAHAGVTTISNLLGPHVAPVCAAMRKWRGAATTQLPNEKTELLVGTSAKGDLLSPALCVGAEPSVDAGNDACMADAISGIIWVLLSTSARIVRAFVPSTSDDVSPCHPPNHLWPLVPPPSPTISGPSTRPSTLVLTP